MMLLGLSAIVPTAISAAVSADSLDSNPTAILSCAVSCIDSDIAIQPYRPYTDFFKDLLKETLLPGGRQILFVKEHLSRFFEDGSSIVNVPGPVPLDVRAPPV